MTGWRRLPFNQRMLFLVLWFCPGLLLLHCGINLAPTKQRMSVAGGQGWAGLQGPAGQPPVLLWCGCPKPQWKCLTLRMGV